MFKILSLPVLSLAAINMHVIRDLSIQLLEMRK